MSHAVQLARLRQSQAHALKVGDTPSLLLTTALAYVDAHDWLASLCSQGNKLRL